MSAWTTMPFFRREPNGDESCFLMEIAGDLTDDQRRKLEKSLAPFFKYLPEHRVTTTPTLTGDHVVSVGPRLTYATPHSSCAVDIFHNSGFPAVNRVELFRRHQIPEGQAPEVYLTDKFDRVTEVVYQEVPDTYQVAYTIPSVKVIPLLEEGIDAVKRFCKDRGIKFTEVHYALIDAIFHAINKNPTDVAIYQLVNMWSDHCRHLLFNAVLVIDGQRHPFTLFDLIREPYKQIRGSRHDNIVTAFHDNASGLAGYTVPLLVPVNPGQAGGFTYVDVSLDLLMSGETHNYPNHVASYEGSATEIGGELRDGAGRGKGSGIYFAGCGRVLGSMCFPNGYRIPGEFKRGMEYIYPNDKRLPLEVFVLGLQGWQDYANRFGKPCLGGFFYSGAVWRPRRAPDGSTYYERVESMKPTCYGFAAGFGRVEHREKGIPTVGCAIVQIGGGAFPIGFCGGLGSSSASGTNAIKFDENAIQRGNGEMERRFYEVLCACMDMGVNSPILSIHDQGAGGPSNVLTELIAEVGGTLYLGAINRGDPTMSDLQVWICEYQERMGIVVKTGRLADLQAICDRFSCPLELLGEVTGDGKLTVYSQRSKAEVRATGAEPIVELPLAQALADLSPITLADELFEDIRMPITIPADLTLNRALRGVLRRSEVASKESIVRGVDGSIGGNVVQNQYCGPFAVPIADCSIAAMSRLAKCGVATSYGVQPFLTTLDPAAGARYSIGEAFTNLMGVAVDIEQIQFICNWMWPASTLDGELARMVVAAKAIRDTLVALKKAIIGGKDSASMATWIKQQLVKSLATIVFSSIVPVPDVAHYVTPDLQLPGESYLIHIDIADGKRRLGGSSFGQALDSQLGDTCPDLDSPELLIAAFMAVQELLRRRLITAGHDNSSGGLLTTVAEMCFASGYGASLQLKETANGLYAECFAEELGFVAECPKEKLTEVEEVLKARGVPYSIVGTTTSRPNFVVQYGEETVLNQSVSSLHREWERTSYQFRRLRINPDAADREWRNKWRHGLAKPTYRLTFEPKPTPPTFFLRSDNPRCVVVTTEGSNGHPEMIEAFIDCGFAVDNIHMSDFRTGLVRTLDPYQLLVGPGGFANSDVLGAAVGWAMEIELSPVENAIFEGFNARPNTLIFGTCNGAQWGLRRRWAPLPDISADEQPLFTLGPIGTFNHQWVRLKIGKSEAVMLRGMEGSILGAWVANAEGFFNCQPHIYERVMREHLAPLVYVDARGRRTSALPYCPSGSPVAGVCDPTGRRLFVMPHMFDRGSLLRQWGYVPPEWQSLEASPWLKMGQNAREWCVAHRA